MTVWHLEVHQTAAALLYVQERYSSPVICLDLVKAAEKAPREIVLRSEFDTAISYINQSVGRLNFAVCDA